MKIFGTLVEKFPNSQFAGPAGELLLDSFNKSNNYDNIETWARRLKTAHGFETPAQQSRLDTLIVQSVFKQGEQKGKANDHLGAAAAYLRAAKEFPKDPRAAQACVNAELEAQKAGDLATLKEAAQLATGKENRDKPESPLGAWTAAGAVAGDVRPAVGQQDDDRGTAAPAFGPGQDGGRVDAGGERGGTSAGQAREAAFGPHQGAGGRQQHRGVPAAESDQRDLIAADVAIRQQQFDGAFRLTQAVKRGGAGGIDGEDGGGFPALAAADDAKIGGPYFEAPWGSESGGSELGYR